jgi:hypothetical protein
MMVYHTKYKGYDYVQPDPPVKLSKNCFQITLRCKRRQMKISGERITVCNAQLIFHLNPETGTKEKIINECITNHTCEGKSFLVFKTLSNFEKT